MVDRIANFILAGRYEYNTRYTPDYPISVSKWISASLENPISEIPYFMSSNIALALSQEYKSIAAPLIADTNLNTRRLVRGAFMDFTRITGRITGVHMSNGNTYYGVPGVIFNENMELLLIVTLTIRKIIDSPRFSVERINCRISPKVFEHQDRIIEKTIVKKIIPFCVSYSVARRDIYLSCREYNCVGKTIQVIIDDCSSFIHTATVPKPSLLTEDKIKSFLVENINEIIQ